MRRPINSLCLAAFALCMSAGAALAATGGGMTVALNESRRVALAGVVANVVVGDPSVADVAMADTHSVIVIGRGYGSTQLVVTAKGGRTLLATEVSVVSSNTGRVTLTRGLDATDFSCTGGRCHPTGPVRPSSGGSSGAGVDPGAPGSNASAASRGGEAAAAAAARTTDQVP